MECAFKFIVLICSIQKKETNLFYSHFEDFFFLIFNIMKSIAINHFPRIIYDGNEKFLFNPVLRKRFKNRPEERVRLKWVEYLLHQTDIKKSRIGFETPVKLRQEKNTLRADLILYDKSMKPESLVECKASSVALNSSAAEQAARYNAEVGARYICLTNGINDFWFEQTEGNIEAISSPVKETLSFNSIEKKQEWWIERGFCSSNSSDDLLIRIGHICSHFWSSSMDWPIRYLDFTTTFLPLNLNHYYRVPVLSPDSKLAISFLGSPDTESYLVAVLNRSGQNSGFLAIRLDDLVRQKPNSAILYKNRDEKFIDAHKKLPLFGDRFNPLIVENLPNFLMRFFD